MQCIPCVGDVQTKLRWSGRCYIHDAKDRARGPLGGFGSATGTCRGAALFEIDCDAAVPKFCFKNVALDAAKGSNVGSLSIGDMTFEADGDASCWLSTAGCSCADKTVPRVNFCCTTRDLSTGKRSAVYFSSLAFDSTIAESAAREDAAAIPADALGRLRVSIRSERGVVTIIWWFTGIVFGDQPEQSIAQGCCSHSISCRWEWWQRSGTSLFTRHNVWPVWSMNTSLTVVCLHYKPWIID